jgi:rare lipoprotein A
VHPMTSRLGAAIVAALCVGPALGADARAADAADAGSPGAAAPTQRPPVSPALQRTGIATIYHDRIGGRTTASGEVYNRNALTAGHRSLPFGTIVRVTNVKNQRQVIVRINDRGSNIGNRVIDLTPRAAAAIGLHGISTGEVRLDVLGSRALATEPAAPDAAGARPVK